MASYLPFLPLISLLLFMTSSFPHKLNLQENAIVLKVTKDLSTLQYLTNVYKGTPFTPTKLVLDLGGSFLWETCSSIHVSSSYRPIHSTSLQCSSANTNRISCFTKGKTCDLPISNSITRSTTRGELAKEILAVDYLDGLGSSFSSISTVQNIVYACVPHLLLNGLASGVKGMLGLGRTRTALPAQLQDNRNFFVCISPSDGVILFTDEQPRFSLSYTPLIPKQIGSSGDYYINLRSIKVNANQISINPKLLSGGSRISTVVPYTTLESSIYNTVASAYVSAATAMNITRVEARSPFGVCFGSDSVGKTTTGPTVPVIDFVLQSEMVMWRFLGGNTMVHVSDEIMCLGFLDGGIGISDAVVIGGYQMENHLLAFDLKSSMLGISSSLSMMQTSCSDFI